MPPSTLDVAVCGVAFALCATIYAKSSKQKNTDLRHPPGPPGLPIIGNLRDLPKQPEWETYLRWSKEYNSELVRLNVFGNNIIVLNSAEAVVDLLERRSSNYSDRHEMTMLNELCGFGWGLAFLRYGQRWRDSRRAFQQDFHLEGVKRFRHLEEASAHKFLGNLLESPNDLMQHLRLMAGALIMKIAYGIDVDSEKDSYLETAEHAVSAISATTNAGSYLVDAIPILKYIPEWFPGAHFQTEARIWRTSIMEMLHKPFDVVKQRMANGDAAECVATSLLDTMAKDAKERPYMESVIRGTLGSMYVAGADTTVSGLGTFFLAMVLFPEIQIKAQKEIDQHCHGRLPSFADYSVLQYVHAIVKEALRWRPVVPLAVPHRCSADDVYKGYFIPKDSLVVGNSWAILHDENAYPEPSSFNPDRFMRNGKINPDVRDPATAAFGYGRRICAGRHMAYESMWIVVASTLAAFTISKVKGSDGIPVTPSGEYDLGFLCYPKPFECDLQPRSAEHRLMVETALQDTT